MKALWSDAWILAAVDWADGGDLSVIVGAADAINHAIPTIEEAQHAFRLLVGSGLLEGEDDRWTLTDEGKSLVQRADDDDIFTVLDRIKASLSELPARSGREKNTRLDPDSYARACQRYFDRPL